MILVNIFEFMIYFTKFFGKHINILIGYNDIGYHNPEVITPYIDKLAYEGIIFERNYVQPSCTPSRSALMTGMYPYKIGRQVHIQY